MVEGTTSIIQQLVATNKLSQSLMRKSLRLKSNLKYLDKGHIDTRSDVKSLDVGHSLNKVLSNAMVHEAQNDEQNVTLSQQTFET
jgi:phage portal protein BeeE